MDISKNTDQGYTETQEISIGRSVYIVERHFCGSKSFKDIFYETIKDEAQQMLRNIPDNDSEDI